MFSPFDALSYTDKYSYITRRGCAKICQQLQRQLKTYICLWVNCIVTVYLRLGNTYLLKHVMWQVVSTATTTAALMTARGYSDKTVMTRWFVDDVVSRVINYAIITHLLAVSSVTRLPGARRTHSTVISVISGRRTTRVVPLVLPIAQDHAVRYVHYAL